MNLGSQKCLIFFGQDELSGDTCDSLMRLDALAGLCAVPDTACPRTLIRGYTSRELEKHLLSKGFKTIRRSDNCTWVWQCGNPSLKRSSFDHCSHRSESNPNVCVCPPQVW